MQILLRFDALSLSEGEDVCEGLVLVGVPTLVKSVLGQEACSLIVFLPPGLVDENDLLFLLDFLESWVDVRLDLEVLAWAVALFTHSAHDLRVFGFDVQMRWGVRQNSWHSMLGDLVGEVELVIEVLFEHLLLLLELLGPGARLVVVFKEVVDDDSSDFFFLVDVKRRITSIELVLVVLHEKDPEMRTLFQNLLAEGFLDQLGLQTRHDALLGELLG